MIPLFDKFSRYCENNGVGHNLFFLFYYKHMLCFSIEVFKKPNGDLHRRSVAFQNVPFPGNFTSNIRFKWRLLNSRHRPDDFMCVSFIYGKNVLYVGVSSIVADIL